MKKDLGTEVGGFIFKGSIPLGYTLVGTIELPNLKFDLVQLALSYWTRTLVIITPC